MKKIRPKILSIDNFFHVNVNTLRLMDICHCLAEKKQKTTTTTHKNNNHTDAETKISNEVRGIAHGKRTHNASTKSRRELR